MPWDKALTYKYGDENVRERHLLNVYADPEFRAEVEQLIGKDGGKLLTAHYDEITKKYRVTEDDVMHYMAGLTAVLPTPKEKPFFINWDDYEKGYITLTVDVNIKEKDFRAIWKPIGTKQQQRRSKQTRNRKYDDDKLVYAIFKELQKNPKLKFPAIFEKYQDGKLDYYRGGATDVFFSAKDLREYYRDYEPTNKPPTLSAAAKRFDRLNDQSIRRYIKKNKPKS